jgi:hypothetical protein
VTAHVNELGVVFRGHTPQDQPPAWWESLLDELKAHHVPSLHPTGKRMSVDVSAEGVVRAVVHFTPSTVGIDEAIKILKKRGIEVQDVRSGPSGG